MTPAELAAALSEWGEDRLEAWREKAAIIAADVPAGAELRPEHEAGVAAYRAMTGSVNHVAKDPNPNTEPTR